MLGLLVPLCCAGWQSKALSIALSAFLQFAQTAVRTYMTTCVSIFGKIEKLHFCRKQTALAHQLTDLGSKCS